MATDSGYSNQKKLGIAQFETIHPMGSNSFGKSTLSKSVYDIQITMAIASVEEELGIDGQVRLWILEIGGHSAVVGNLLKFDPASSLPNFYFEVMEVRNFDKIAVLPIAEALPQVGDTVDILGFVTSKLSALGETSVSITTPPTSFEYNGSPQTVIQDTAVVANNRALPNLAFIIKDGNQVPVTKDTATPSNTVGMPVEIVAASGTPINITAGDLNVQLSDQGVNADVVRIGDGTTQLGITLANEAKVHDQDVLNTLNDITGQLPLSLGGKASVNSLAVVLSTEQETLLTDTVTNTTSIAGSTNQIALATSGINTLLPINATLVGGSDGTNLVPVKTSATGEVNTLSKITNGSLINTLKDVSTPVASGDIGIVTNAVIHGVTTAGGGAYVDVKVTPSGAMSVEVGSSALPTGASTEAKQDTLIAKDFATQTTLAALLVELALKADLSETQPVSIASAIPSTINAGTITSAQITVGTSAVRATVSGSAPNAARKKLMIKPSKNNTGAIYLGASTATTANSMEIIGPDRLEFEFDASDFYVISDTAAQVVEIIEVV